MRFAQQISLPCYTCKLILQHAEIVYTIKTSQFEYVSIFNTGPINILLKCHENIYINRSSISNIQSITVLPIPSLTRHYNHKFTSYIIPSHDYQQNRRQLSRYMKMYSFHIIFLLDYTQYNGIWYQKNKCTMSRSDKIPKQYGRSLVI